MIPKAPPATVIVDFPVNSDAARRMNVMVRKKKTATRPTEERSEARRKMKVTSAQAVR